jgi:teichuronic acid exporter
MDGYKFEAIAAKSIKGIFALISRNFFLNFVSIISLLVISSTLPVSDIGIYTAVIAIQRIISFFIDAGFGAALIQKKETITQSEITTVFTLQAAVTLVIFFIVLIFRTTIAQSFGLDEDAQMLLLVLVFTLFLSSFKIIPSILLERTISFSRLVIPHIVESLSFNFILIALVLGGFRIESYTWAFLISSVISIPIYYVVSPWKIRIGIDKKSLSHLKYGTQFQAKNILATIKDDLLTVILVKILSFAEIGYIGFAQRLAFYIYRYIVDSVTKVTFPAYARIQHDIHAMRRAIEKSLFFVTTLMFPILCGLAILAPYIIDLYPKWNNKMEPAVISIIFFCLNAMVSSMSGILVNVLDATGKVKTTLRLMVIWTILTWLLTPLLVIWVGFHGVAIASFIVTLTIFYTVYLTKKIVEYDFFKSIYKPLLASVVMSVVLYSFAFFVVRSLSLLLVAILLGGLVYATMMYILAREEIEKDIRLLLRR